MTFPTSVPRERRRPSDWETREAGATLSVGPRFRLLNANSSARIRIAAKPSTAASARWYHPSARIGKRSLVEDARVGSHMLKLPEGVDTAFRVVATDAFDGRFSVNAYGSGRGGWFVATLRHYGPDQDSGVRQLPKGEWPTLLHLIDRCGYWGLPEDDSHLADPTVTVDDGEFLTIAGRDAKRYHRVHRFIWREPGLEAVLAFSRRVSGYFVRHPVSGWWIPPPVPELTSQLAAPETHTVAALGPTTL